MVENSTEDLQSDSSVSSDMQLEEDICDVNEEQLWDHFSSTVAPEIIKFHVRESTSPPTIGRLLHQVYSKITKVEVGMQDST